MYSIQGSQLSPAGGAGKGASTSFPEAGVHSAFTFLCLNCPIFGQWDKLAPSDILTMSEASLHPQMFWLALFSLALPWTPLFCREPALV